jgi:ornithine carbamoyltransferase
VANTCGMMQLQNADFVIHPKGYELNPKSQKIPLIEYDQNKAFENADFIYTKTGVVTATMKKLQFRSKLDRYCRENEIDKQCQIHALFTRKT